jgi:hypothetical protein
MTTHDHSHHTRLLTTSDHDYRTYTQTGPHKGADGGTIIVTPHTFSRQI